MYKNFAVCCHILSVIHRKRNILKKKKKNKSFNFSPFNYDCCSLPDINWQSPSNYEISMVFAEFDVSKGIIIEIIIK